MTERNDDAEDRAQKGGDDKPRQGGVADYLQAPKRKRKSYVVIATGKGVNVDTASLVMNFVRSQYKQFAVSTPKTLDELARQAGRNIQLIIMDDEFSELGRCLETIKIIKQKKHDVTLPVLFMTRRPEELVAAYNKILLPWQETDEYVAHVASTPSQVLSRVKAGLEASNRRRSRRYKVDIPCRFSVLGQEHFDGINIVPKLREGRIVDLSVHGCLLKASDGYVFKMRDQIKIHLPVSSVLTPRDGDIIRLSAKIRRVYISGEQIGVSFEHLSEKQLFIITQFVTELVESQLARRAAASLART